MVPGQAEADQLGMSQGKVVSGGRVGTAYRRKEMVKVDRLPNYIDILLS